MPIGSAYSKSIALGCALAVLPASALIVVDGKIVSAWPETGETRALPKTGAGAGAEAAAHYYPHPTGEVWGLTLMVDFSDTPPTFTKAEVDDWLNLKGFNRFGCQGSVRDYYSDVSNGKVDLRNEVYGYYRAKQPKAYYEGTTGYARASELVAEMLEHFDGQVDFSRFDNDKDGKVEALSIVYAGKGQTWGQGLWPHAGSLNQRRDGVQVPRYMMTDLGTSLSLYVFCHETGHMVFSWPDLYGFGDYCLMGNRPNDFNPVCINDFYRADQGWIDVVEVDKDMNAFFKAGANANVGWRFANPARPQESFFWSHLRNTGRRAALKGSGLLILHFDKDIGRNDPPNPLSLAVVQADGKGDLDTATWPSPGSDVRDYFNQANGAAFGAVSKPAAKWNNGSASGLNLHDIGPVGDTLGFYVGTGVVGLPRPAALSGRPGIRKPERWDAQGVSGPRAIGPGLGLTPVP